MSLKMNLKDKLNDDILDLSMCDLQEVPVREIASIRKATSLDLSNNGLVSLPKTFITLTQVVKLDLSKNMLTELPENFGELRQLKFLDLYSNKISRLPLSLGELKNLKWLDLKENPLTPAVASVAGLCSDAKECQACARNVVAYLAQVKQTVDEEKLRRINAITAAEPEREGAPAKKEGKKKKKRSEDKENKLMEKGKSGIQKSEQLTGNGHPPSMIQKPEGGHVTQKNSGKDGAARRICRTLTSLLFWWITLTFLVILALVTLPLFDKEKSDAITSYIELKIGQPVKQYQQLGTKSLEKLIDNVIFWSDDIQVRLTKVYSQYFGEKAIVTSKKEL